MAFSPLPSQRPLQRAGGIQVLPTVASPLPFAPLTSAPSSAGEETPQQQAQWLRTLQGTLATSPQALRQLEQLNRQGTLQATQGPVDPADGQAHSTLFYLHQLASTPRAQGLQGPLLAQETLRLLTQPSLWHQGLQPLQPAAAQGLQGSYGASSPPMARLQRHEFNGCAVAVVLSRVASTQPNQLARMVAQASGPSQCMVATTTAQELSPSQPAQAPQVLRQHALQGAPVAGSNQWQVALPVPAAGYWRAVNAQAAPCFVPNVASSAEILLQSTLLYNMSGRQYDVGLDERKDTPQGTGLTQAEQLVLERLLTPGHRLETLTCQQLGRDPATAKPVLVGYTQPFEHTKAQLQAALRSPLKEVVVDLVDPDGQGHLPVGHVVKVMNWRPNPLHPQQAQFLVADTSGKHPGEKWVSEALLVPKVHHMTVEAQRPLPPVEAADARQGLSLQQANAATQYRGLRFNTAAAGAFQTT